MKKNYALVKYMPAVLLAGAFFLTYPVQGEDTAARDRDNAPVSSSYEFRSISYGDNQDGRTYHRIITMRDGVKDADVTTVGGSAMWDTDDQGQYVNGYMNGIEIKEGNVKANNVAAENIQSATANIGTVYGTAIHVGSGSLGGVQFTGSGVVTGVQTNEADPTSAVSLAYLNQKLNALEAENQKLQEEIEALKKK